MNIISYLLFGLAFILGSFSAMAEGGKPMVTVESHLEYKLSAASYDPQRADIKGNIAKLEGEIKLFDPNGAQYAAGLANISRLQDWLGERDKARMNRVRAFEIFEKNFYPAASSVTEFRAYIGLLNDSAPASASCAKANDLFKALLERDPDNILIYEFIPTCQLDGIRTKKGLAPIKAWFDAGRHKFAGIEASKAAEPDTLWLAERFYGNYLTFRVITEHLERLEPASKAYSISSFYNELYSHVKRMRELAERLNALSPKDVASQGLLGSLCLGEYFFSIFQPKEILDNIQAPAQLDRAIRLLKQVAADKKGTFPAAYNDLAKAYAIKRDYASAFSVQADGIKRYPDFREGAETLVAIYALEKHESTDETAIKKRAGVVAGILIERLERSADQTPRDYLLIARLCEITGSLQDAVNYIEKGLILFPNDPALNDAAKNLKIKN